MNPRIIQHEERLRTPFTKLSKIVKSLSGSRRKRLGWTSSEDRRTTSSTGTSLFKGLITLSGHKFPTIRNQSLVHESGPADLSPSRNSFKLLSLVGMGTFGKVLLAREIDTGSAVAIKMLARKELIQRGQIQHTLAERRIMELVRDQPFFAHLRHAFMDKSHLYLVSNFCSGGELFFHLRAKNTFGEDLTRFYLAQVAVALEFLHANGVAYRDLKSENLLLTHDGHLVLTDFGLAKENIGETSGARSICGTVAFVAPEMIHCGRGSLRSYGYTVDWWALGVLAYDMLVGNQPFVAENQAKLCTRIVTGKFRFPQGHGLSEVCRQFINDCLIVQPEKRLGSLSVGGWKSIQQHPFFLQALPSDWNASTLLNMQSPEELYKPHNENNFDLSNFDSTFTARPMSCDASRARKSGLFNHFRLRRSVTSSEPVVDDDFSEYCEEWSFTETVNDAHIQVSVMDASNSSKNKQKHEKDICAA